MRVSSSSLAMLALAAGVVRAGLAAPEVLVVPGCLGTTRRTVSMRYAPFGLRCGGTARRHRLSAGVTSQMMAERRMRGPTAASDGGGGTVITRRGA